MQQGNVIKYGEQNRDQRKQIFRFIKRIYPSATGRDVIGGLHSVIEKDGKLTGVATDLSMVAKYSKNQPITN